MKLLEAIKQFDESYDEKTGDIENQKKYDDALETIVETIVLSKTEWGTLEKVLENIYGEIENLQKEISQLKQHKHTEGKVVVEL